MKQNELIEKVAAELGMTKKDVKEVVLETLAWIRDSLIDKEEVQLPGFGTFKTVERAARKGRNPATGKEMMFAASTGVKFKVGATLKRAVKEG